MKNHIEDLEILLFSSSLKSLEVLILAIFLFSIYSSHLLSVEFQPDETFWIVSSPRFDKFVAGEFDDPVWIEEPLISFEVRPIPSYLVAISQRLAGIKADSLPNYWDWSISKQENISQGAMPSAKVLWWSRLPMALVSVLSLLVVISLLARAHSRLAAYLFAWVSLNGYFLLHLRRAMSEAPLLLFTVLVLYSSYKLFRATQENSLRKIIVSSIIIGVFSGMAGQSKLTGLACIGIAILGTLVSILRPADDSETPRRQVLFLVPLITGCTALLIFLVSYPFFYRNTLHRVLTTFYVRGLVVEAQINQYEDQVIHPTQRPQVLFQRIFELPLKPECSGTADLLFNGINLLIAASGFSFSLRQVWLKRQNWEIILVLLLGALVCAVPMLFIPLDWDRYYLYPILFSCIFFVIGLGRFFSFGFSWFRKQIDKKPVTAG